MRKFSAFAVIFQRFNVKRFMSQHTFCLDQASARSVKVYQPYHVFRAKQKTPVIYSQPRFVDETPFSFTSPPTNKPVINFTATVSKFWVYALSHAKIKRWHIAQETLIQYQRELDARQLTEDILSKKFDGIYTNRKNRNYNNVEREIIHKSGWKGQHEVDSSYAAGVPHWAGLRANGRKGVDEGR